MSTKQISQEPICSYEVISRFAKFEGEQFEIRLRNEKNEWMAFLNFRDPDATRRTNGYNNQGIPELFIKPEQYLGTIKLLESGDTWFRLGESSDTDIGLDCWVSSFTV